MDDTLEGIPAGAAWAYEEWLKEQEEEDDELRSLEANCWV